MLRMSRLEKGTKGTTSVPGGRSHSEEIVAREKRDQTCPWAAPRSTCNQDALYSTPCGPQVSKVCLLSRLHLIKNNQGTHDHTSVRQAEPPIPEETSVATSAGSVPGCFSTTSLASQQQLTPLATIVISTSPNFRDVTLLIFLLFLSLSAPLTHPFPWLVSGLGVPFHAVPLRRWASIYGSVPTTLRFVLQSVHLPYLSDHHCLSLIPWPPGHHGNPATTAHWAFPKMNILSPPRLALGPSH